MPAQPDQLRPGELMLDDDPRQQVTDAWEGRVAGEWKAKGLIPRNYTTHPVGSYASALPYSAVDMPLIPRSEWSERIKEMVETKSLLSEIRLTGNNGQSIPSLDQNGQGYCWMYSGTGAVMMLRAVNNQPYVRLSAHAGACIIKNFRDQGGWGAAGLDFLVARGQPSVEFWPEKSMAKANDKPETWANAALHKVTEGWIDMEDAAYDRNLTWDQVMTCLLSRIPVIADFNHWGHSVCLLDPVEVEPGSFGVRLLNSWSDSWSDRGMGTLRGSKAIPDGATAPRVTTPSVN